MDRAQLDCDWVQRHQQLCAAPTDPGCGGGEGGEEQTAAYQWLVGAAADSTKQCPEACDGCGPALRGCIGFSPEFMGWLRSISHVAYLAGVATYNRFFKRTPLRLMVRRAARE